MSDLNLRIERKAIISTEKTQFWFSFMVSANKYKEYFATLLSSFLLIFQLYLLYRICIWILVCGFLHTDFQAESNWFRFKGYFSCVLQDATKYSRNIELHLFILCIRFPVIANPTGVQENERLLVLSTQKCYNPFLLPVKSEKNIFAKDLLLTKISKCIQVFLLHLVKKNNPV